PSRVAESSAFSRSGRCTVMTRTASWSAMRRQGSFMRNRLQEGWMNRPRELAARGLVTGRRQWRLSPPVVILARPAGGGLTAPCRVWAGIPADRTPLESDRMKVRLLAASLAALILVSATASAQDTSSERGKLSYAIGFNTGVELAELAARGEAVDVNTVIKAIQDAYAKKQPAVPVEELKTAVENMQKRQQAKMEAE